MNDPRDFPIEDVGEWANGQPLTISEQARVSLLREAGCSCKWPLLGTRPTGPRCRICNAEAVWRDTHDITAEPAIKMNGDVVGYQFHCSCGRTSRGFQTTPEKALERGRDHIRPSTWQGPMNGDGVSSL